MKRCQYSCEAVPKVQTAKSAPPLLCTIALKSAISINAFYCKEPDRYIQAISQWVYIYPFHNRHVNKLYLLHTKYVLKKLIELCRPTVNAYWKFGRSHKMDPCKLRCEHFTVGHRN